MRRYDRQTANRTVVISELPATIAGCRHLVAAWHDGLVFEKLAAVYTKDKGVLRNWYEVGRRSKERYGK